MIFVPISAGELLDKITILEIKIERMGDEVKRANCRKEYELLQKVAQENDISFHEERGQLKKVNEELWDIEDAMRRAEASMKFGEGFIELTRNEYRANDLRAAIKKRINMKIGSELVEEKDYVEYKK